MRAAVLSAQPFCADCALEGYLTPATEVHHKVPVDEGASPEKMAALCFDASNVVGLCHDCHVKRHVDLRSHRAGTTAARAKKEAQEFWQRVDARAGAPSGAEETPGGTF